MTETDPSALAVDRLRCALLDIYQSHVPDQPATSQADEATWVMQHVSRLRKIAADALASCDTAMRQQNVDLADTRAAARVSAHLWQCRAVVAESALATERARVVHEIIAAVRSLARIVLGDYSEGYMYAIGDVERAIRALIPATPGAPAPSTSTASGPGAPRRREWFVINNSMMNSVWAEDDAKIPLGYIPRDACEKLLGRKIEDGRTTWFTREEGEKMRAHPEWRTTDPTCGD